VNRDEYAKMFAMEDHYWWFQAKRHFLQAALGTVSERLPARPRILDIGCGTGAVLEMLAPHGEAHGIDIESAALAFCAERQLGNLVQSSAAALPYADGSFDLIVAADMLEHLPEDAPAVRESARVLRPGGVLLCTVPAHPKLYGEHDIALHHFRRYSQQSLCGMIEGAGLRLTRISPTFASILLPALIVRGLKNSTAKPVAEENAQSDFPPLPRPLNALTVSVHRLEAWWLARRNLPFGLSYLGLAEKPET
jgi:SAM-dependent methyltransferase